MHNNGLFYFINENKYIYIYFLNCLTLYRGIRMFLNRQGVIKREVQTQSLGRNNKTEHFFKTTKKFQTP